MSLEQATKIAKEIKFYLGMWPEISPSADKGDEFHWMRIQMVANKLHLGEVQWSMRSLEVAEMACPLLRDAIEGCLACWKELEDEVGKLMPVTPVERTELPEF